MRLELPEWSRQVAPTDESWVRALCEGPARERLGVLADATVDDVAGEVVRRLRELEPIVSALLAPVDASPGLVFGQVVEWSERLTPDLAETAVVHLGDHVGDTGTVEHTDTALDQALVVRRPRQLQAVVPERGTGKALVLTWEVFGDVGWEVHEQAFARLVASASSSATVDLAQR